MIACAADEIYADPASIVGSIGVVSASFGFHELIERIGVERRVHLPARARPCSTRSGPRTRTTWCA